MPPNQVLIAIGTFYDRVDQLDSWNTDTTPIHFKNKETLAAYIKASKNPFGRHIATRDQVLCVLPRSLLWRSSVFISTRGDGRREL